MNLKDKTLLGNEIAQIINLCAEEADEGKKVCTIDNMSRDAFDSLGKIGLLVIDYIIASNGNYNRIKIHGWEE